jgi:hypothetical protein
MIRTVPLRRITRQLRHSGLMDARTFMALSSFWISTAAVAFEIRFAQQACVLMRGQMGLNLRNEIHNYDDDNQQ